MRQVVGQHSYGIDGFRAAVRAGADVMAHLPVDRLDDSDVDTIVAAGTIVIPTLYHMHCRVNAYFPHDDDKNGPDFDPERWRREFTLMENDETWGERLWTQLHRFDRPLGSSNPCYCDMPLDFDLVAQSTANMRDSLSRLHDAGAAIAYGQDSSHSIPYRELRELLRCGLTPSDALAAATSGAAAAIGRASDRGRLQAGMRADLVVYEDSPLDHFTALADLPVAVVRNGVMVRGRPEATSGMPGGLSPRFPPLDRAARTRFVSRYLGALGLGALRGFDAPHRRAVYDRRPCEAGRMFHQTHR